MGHTAGTRRPHRLLGLPPPPAWGPDEASIVSPARESSSNSAVMTRIRSGSTNRLKTRSFDEAGPGPKRGTASALVMPSLSPPTAGVVRDSSTSSSSAHGTAARFPKARMVKPLTTRWSIGPGSRSDRPDPGGNGASFTSCSSHAALSSQSRPDDAGVALNSYLHDAQASCDALVGSLVPHDQDPATLAGLHG